MPGKTLFVQMAPKAKKEGPAPPKAEARAKALKAMKVVLGGVHSHKKRSAHQPKIAKDTAAAEAAYLSLEEHPRETQA